MRPIKLLGAALALLLAGMAAPALAADPPAIPKIADGDTAWMLAATALVLMMAVPGVALFYGGMVRKANVLSITMQIFSITALVTVLWVILGYTIAFSNGGSFMGGMDYFLLSALGLQTPITSGVGVNIPEAVFVVFQMTFAIVTVCLITGAVADRMKFGSMLLFAGLWLILVYAPIAHWVWWPDIDGDGPIIAGFLAADGVLDFAGGTVVHINSGVAGLVAALIVGRRQGYGKIEMAPHNLVYSLIGASMLWFGWFGFNAGSAIAVGPFLKEGDSMMWLAGWAMLTTQAATGAAALAWLVAEWLMKGKPSVLGAISGAVAGLVAITPAAGFVGVGGALIIGLLAGIVCFWACAYLKKMLGYDDALDAFGVHGVGGFLGAVLTGVFALGAIGGYPGLIDGNPAQLWIQLKGALIVAAYTAIMTAVILYAIKFTLGLRVSEEIERDGLDIAVHGESVH